MSFLWILAFPAIIFAAYFVVEYVVDMIISWPFEQ